MHTSSVSLVWGADKCKVKKEAGFGSGDYAFVCVCVSTHACVWLLAPLVLVSARPRALHMGFVLIVLWKEGGKWMLSELIGMTIRAYGCVCARCMVVAVTIFFYAGMPGASWTNPLRVSKSCASATDRGSWPSCFVEGCGNIYICGVSMLCRQNKGIFVFTSR